MKLKRRRIPHATAFWLIMPLSACVTLSVSLGLAVTDTTSASIDLQLRSIGMLLVYTFVGTAILAALSVWGRSSETRRTVMLLLLAFVPLWGLPLMYLLFGLVGFVWMMIE